MTRKSSPKPPHSKSSGGTLVGMFIGLVLGVCIAAGVVWYINRAHSPFVANKQQRGEVPAAPTNGKPGAPQQPLALSGKPGDPMPQKRFDFHDILTGKSDALPESKPAAKPADGNETAKPDSKKDDAKTVKDAKDVKDPKESKESKQPVFFQAGSFTSAQDADNQKAKLALMGMEASILQVMVQDKTFYRVRIGPYGNNEEASRIRSELAKNGIDVTLTKKEP